MYYYYTVHKLWNLRKISWIELNPHTSENTNTQTNQIRQFYCNTNWIVQLKYQEQTRRAIIARRRTSESERRKKKTSEIDFVEEFERFVCCHRNPLTSLSSNRNGYKNKTHSRNLQWHFINTLTPQYKTALRGVKVRTRSADGKEK